MTTRTFYGINYPAHVVNEQNAIKTLGGAERVEQVFQRKNGKLLLNFQPDNIFSKLLCSTQLDSGGAAADEPQTPFGESTHDLSQLQVSHHQAAPTTASAQLLATGQNDQQPLMPCLLMQVKKKNKNKSPEVKILGVVSRMYVFNSIADFQYLPMSSEAKAVKSGAVEKTVTTYDAFYKHFRFDDIENHEEDFRQDIPLYVLPPFFSRFDIPINYAFRADSANTAKPAVAKKREQEESKKDSDGKF